MTNISTLFYISDNILNPESQLFDLDKFLDTLDTELDSIFADAELCPAINIKALVNKVLQQKK